MDFWARDNKIKMNESESYFVTLFPVVDNKNGEKLLGIKTNNGLIKISENITLDEKNYYGFGKVPWQEFKKNISNSINMTKGE